MSFDGRLLAHSKNVVVFLTASAEINIQYGNVSVMTTMQDFKTLHEVVQSSAKFLANHQLCQDNRDFEDEKV